MGAAVLRIVLTRIGACVERATRANSTAAASSDTAREGMGRARAAYRRRRYRGRGLVNLHVDGAPDGGAGLAQLGPGAQQLHQRRLAHP